MNTGSKSDSYAAAGVDITAGYRAVELMKKHIARTASELLFERIEGKASPEKQHLVLPTKLELGNTTSPFEK